MVDGLDSAWRNRAPGPHRNTARQAMDGLWTEVCGPQKQSNDPGNNQPGVIDFGIVGHHDGLGKPPGFFQAPETSES